MDVRNCKTCGRMFNYLGGIPICPICKKELDDKFDKVKEYVRTNPQSSISQVAEDNDVTVPQIRQWVREERLEFSKDSPVTIECESCGVSIYTGRFCDKCKSKMSNNLTSAFKRPEPKVEPKKPQSETDRMRFLK